jgi:hypothetical protein
VPPASLSYSIIDAYCAPLVFCYTNLTRALPYSSIICAYCTHLVLSYKQCRPALLCLSDMRHDGFNDDQAIQLFVEILHYAKLLFKFISLFKIIYYSNWQYCLSNSSKILTRIKNLYIYIHTQKCYLSPRVIITQQKIADQNVSHLWFWSVISYCQYILV